MMAKFYPKSKYINKKWSKAMDTVRSGLAGWELLREYEQYAKIYIYTHY